jgi:uncharacterized protein (TIGR00725 family)
MGAGEDARPETIELAGKLGRAIASRGWVLLTGGRPVGVMEAACRGASEVENHLIVGVLPDPGKGLARIETAPVDLALFTDMGQARNVINVLSADVVVVCGAGGAGTASEAAHAIKAERPLILLAVPTLWEQFFASLGGVVRFASDVDQCCASIESLLASI